MSSKTQVVFNIIVLVIAVAALWMPRLPAPSGSAPAAAGGAEVVQAAAGGAAAPGVYKVVYHADFSDPARFSAMLTNINNMIDSYMGELADYDIRIVFLAHGIRFITRDPLAGTGFSEDAALAERRDELWNRLKSLHDVHKVKLELCNITRNAVGLDESKVLDGVDMVPSGVVRIAQLQSQGFAYLKVQ